LIHKYSFISKEWTYEIKMLSFDFLPFLMINAVGDDLFDQNCSMNLLWYKIYSTFFALNKNSISW